MFALQNWGLRPTGPSADPKAQDAAPLMRPSHNERRPQQLKNAAHGLAPAAALTRLPQPPAGQVSACMPCPSKPAGPPQTLPGAGQILNCKPQLGKPNACQSDATHSGPAAARLRAGAAAGSAHPPLAAGAHTSVSAAAAPLVSAGAASAKKAWRSAARAVMRSAGS